MKNKKIKLDNLQIDVGLDLIAKYRQKKYIVKWSLKRSRIAFLFRIIKKSMGGHYSILYSEGGHYIDGPMGAGKTLLMNIILENMLSTGGFAWQNVNEFFYKPVKTFDLDLLFSDGKPLYKLDNVDEKGRRCKALILDEINATFNRRQNHQKAYNDLFVPLVKMLVTLRNAMSIPRFYLIGQSLLIQDTQLQEVIKYRHFVKCKKRWRYWFFRNQLKVEKVPYKLKIEDFIKVGTDQAGKAIWQKLKGKHIIKVPCWVFNTFNTHAFSELFANLPNYSTKKTGSQT